MQYMWYNGGIFNAGRGSHVQIDLYFCIMCVLLVIIYFKVKCRSDKHLYYYYRSPFSDRVGLPLHKIISLSVFRLFNHVLLGRPTGFLH